MTFSLFPWSVMITEGKPSLDSHLSSIHLVISLDSAILMAAASQSLVIVPHRFDPSIGCLLIIQASRWEGKGLYFVLP